METEKKRGTKINEWFHWRNPVQRYCHDEIVTEITSGMNRMVLNRRMQRDPAFSRLGQRHARRRRRYRKEVGYHGTASRSSSWNDRREEEDACR